MFVKGVRLILLREQSCILAFVAGRREPFADRCRSMHIRLRKARHRSRIICLLLFVSCPSLLYVVVVGAYPINIFIRYYYFMCVFTRRSYTHSSLVQLLQHADDFEPISG